MGAEAATPPAVLLVPFPAQGHVTPMLRLARALAAHGVAVTVAVPDFIHRRIAGTTAGSDDDGVALASIASGVADCGADPPGFAEFGHAMEHHMPAHLERLLARRRVACVVVDVLASWAVPVAERCGVPAAGFWPAMLASYRVVAAIPELMEEGLISESGAQPGQDASSPRHLAGTGRAQERRAPMARRRLGYPEIEVRVLAPGSAPRAELPLRPRQLLPQRGGRCRRRGRRRPPGAAGPAGLPGGAAAGARRGRQQHGAANERRRAPGGTVQAAAAQQHVAGRLDVHGLAGQATCGVSGVRLLRQLGGADRAREGPRARVGAGGHRPALPVGAQEGPVVARWAPRRVRRGGGRRRPRQGGGLGAAGGRAEARRRRLLPHALRLELHRRGHTARGAPPVLPRLRGPVHQLRLHHSCVGDRDQARRRHEQRRGEGLHREGHGRQGREASAGEDGLAEGESRDGRRKEYSATERQVLRERN
uniref:Glycosyltransferase N-terminal domain-containing protein n=1 Tax=Aegilops tauschii subsp. strangulata TaxID=200361 RepID=A0A453CGX1_AEGTS